MKLKILMAPFTLLASMILFIWFVYPAFSNPAQKNGVKEENQKLSEEKEKLEKAKEITAKVNSLWGQIESSVAEKNILLQYLPEKAQEEEVIDNINFIFSSSGVSISNFSVSINEKDGVTKKAVVKFEGVSGEGADAQIAKAEPVDFLVSFSVFGKYESMKEFLQKINNLGRYNQIQNLTISVMRGEEGKETDVLAAKGEMGFNYMEKKILEGVEEISLSDLDVASISRIKEEKTTDILKLPPFEKGRPNPFSL